jgi:hypothetical protein
VKQCPVTGLRGVCASGEAALWSEFITTANVTLSPSPVTIALCIWQSNQHTNVTIGLLAAYAGGIYVSWVCQTIPHVRKLCEFT